MCSSIRRKDRSKRSKMVCYSLLPSTEPSLAGFALGVSGHLLGQQSLIKGQLTACSDHQYLTATTLGADRQLQVGMLGTAHLIKKEPSKGDFQSMLKTKYSVLELTQGPILRGTTGPPEQPGLCPHQLQSHSCSSMALR